MPEMKLLWWRRDGPRGMLNRDGGLRSADDICHLDLPLVLSYFFVGIPKIYYISDDTD